jgi:uncharacterized DUF497 family protein
MYDFRWIAWNVNHVARHGVTPAEAEYVVNQARRPFPRRIEDDKRLVWGQTADGTYLQVIYVLDPDGAVFVIHAMPMTQKQKRQFKRRRNR